MPTARKQDGTSLRPAEEPVHAVPAAQQECVLCGEVYTGAHTCPTLKMASVTPFMAPLRPSGDLGTREQIQSELDLMAFAIRAFHLKQPDQVMRECAAYSARLTEMCVLLHRVEALDRQYTRVRTAQVERWLTELDRQFKIASRLVEVNRQDLELMR